MAGRPDVDLFTSVKAKELKFGRVPKTSLRFEGEPAHDSHSRVERENLPEEVEEGVVYRDVKVDWTVTQRIVHPTDAAADEAVEGEEKG